MKKIAGMLICIAVAFSFAGCSWQVPERVSVKTSQSASYNFSLGNIEKDLTETLNISKMLGNMNLPNNGKLYDYWPEKKGDTQKFLMYMPLQEIPVDIGSYFDKGALAENIKNISFEQEFAVPDVHFSFNVDNFSLDSVNQAIGEQFVLAGLVGDYDSSAFSSILSQVAESISYEKGTLVVKAYNITLEDLAAINGGSSVESFVSDDKIATDYSGGTVSIISGSESISGTFSNGIAIVDIPSTGFNFIANNTRITFTDKPSISSPLVFVARFDTNPANPYQIKKLSHLGPAISTIPSVTLDQKVDALKSLEAAGVEECKIAEGSIDLKFELPAEWENVEITYGLTMTGGIDLASTGNSVVAGSSNITNLSLNNTSIDAEEVTVNAALVLSLDDATIDFTKKPAVSISSDIKKIETVTIKLPASVSIPDEMKTQKLPDAALDILKRMTLGRCGLKGTYTNTLPAENSIDFTVVSNFFDLNKTLEIASTLAESSGEKSFELLSGTDDANYERTIKIAKEPSATDEYNSFDFDIGLPEKITVKNVEPGKTYKLGINVEPVINWKSVTLNTEKFNLPASSIGTGFDPSTITNSIKEALKTDIADKIDLPDCNLYLYITKPGITELNNLSFNGSEISLYYGDSDKVQITGTTKKEIISSTSELTLVAEAPKLKTEVTGVITDEDGKEVPVETVISTLPTALGDYTVKLALSDIIRDIPDVSGEKQLCVNYKIKLSGVNGDAANELTITNSNTDGSIKFDQSGTIGVYAALELPLSFKFTEAANIDLKKFMYQEGESNDKDLFGRSEATGFDEIKKYLGIIDSASIYYRPDAFPIMTTEDINISLALGDDIKTVSKTLRLSKNGDTLSVNSEDIDTLFESYPLRLKTASIDFAKDNEISIPREKNISVNLQIGITTLNDEPIEIFNVKK